MTFVKIAFWFFIGLLAISLLVYAIGRYRFNKLIEGDLHNLQLSVDQHRNSKPLTLDHDTMPPIVSTWLRHAGIGPAQSDLNRVALQQRGRMRTSPGGKWMPFSAEQHFSIKEPGFVWVADVKAAGPVYMNARDLFENGEGNMLIKVASVFTVADGKGPEIDQGSMVRYLAEVCWFPQAALCNYIQWESIDTLSAQATMQFRGKTAKGIFTFTPEGELRSFDALRHYDQNGKSSLEKWHIETDPGSYISSNGIRIPSKSSVTWQLEEGDFRWLELEVVSIEYE